jgi:hypothetical protein
MSALTRTFTLFLPLAMLAAAQVPNFVQLKKMRARFARAEMRVDTARLPDGDRKALVKLIQAARLINEIYMRQVWSANPATYAKAQSNLSALGRERMLYYWINKAPWSELDGYTAFLPGVPARKPAGGSFYPADMSREEFEGWLKGLPREEQVQATGFFTVIRRDSGGKLTVVPYHKEYGAELQKAAQFLKEASALTGNESLKRFLTLRADAFLSDDYYASDLAWMDLDAPLDVTIGPYETYTDELLGYKAAYEAYLCLRDEAETARLKFFADHMQEIEDNLPIEAKYRNPKLGAAAPIRVVNEIIATGDGAHGVRTAAFNLPNDERVIREKGSKRVMLKNVQEAKFHLVLEPVSKRVLAPAAQSDLSFDAFFTHILAHEMTHGIGPHQVTDGGKVSTPRQELKDLYGTIEEAKADVCGLFMLQHLLDKSLLKGSAVNERNLYTTYLASAFRSLRFGFADAHGKGMAIQVRYLMEKGAFRAAGDGTFSVDSARMKGAIRDLAHDLLTVEAAGDYASAQAMMEGARVLPPQFQKALEQLKDIPIDLEPEFVTATSLARSNWSAARPGSGSQKKTPPRATRK